MAGPLDNKKILQKVDQSNRVQEENSKQIADLTKTVEQQNKENKSFFERIINDLTKSNVNSAKGPDLNKTKDLSNDVKNLEANKDAAAKSIIDKIIDGVKNQKTEVTTKTPPPSESSIPTISKSIDPSIIQFLQDYKDQGVEDGVSNLIQSLKRLAEQLPDKGLSGSSKQTKEGETPKIDTKSQYPDFTNFSNSMSMMLNSLKLFKPEEIEKSVRTVRLFNKSGIVNTLINTFNSFKNLDVQEEAKEKGKRDSVFNTIKAVTDFFNKIGDISLSSLKNIKKLQIALRTANPANLINTFYSGFKKGIDYKAIADVQPIFSGFNTMFKTLGELPKKIKEVLFGFAVFKTINFASTFQKIFNDFIKFYEEIESHSVIQKFQKPVPQKDKDNEDVLSKNESAFSLLGNFFDELIKTVKKPLTTFDAKFIKEVLKSFANLQLISALMPMWTKSLNNIFTKLTKIQFKKQETEEGTITIDQALAGIKKTLTGLKDVFDIIKDITENSISSAIKFNFSLFLLKGSIKKIGKFSKELQSNLPELFTFLEASIKSSDKLSKLKGEEMSYDGKKEKVMGGLGDVIRSLQILPKVLKKLAKARPYMAASQGVIKSIGVAIESLTNRLKHTRRLKNAAVSLELLSTAILMFSLKVLGATLILSKINPLGFVYLTLSFGIFFLLTLKFGSVRSFKKSFLAAQTLAMLGLGLLSMAIGMLVTSKIMGEIDWVNLALGLAVMIGILFLFNFISKKIASIALAAAGLALIGLSMIVFSIGLLVLGGTITLLGPGGVLLSMLTLVAVVGIMYLLSNIFKNPQTALSVIIGVGAMILMGISLIILGLGLAIYFKAISNIPIKTAIAGLTLIGVLGGIVYLLGLGAQYTIIGAAVLLVMGISMMMFAIAAKIFFEIKFPDKQMQKNMSGSLIELFKSIAIAGVLSPFLLLGAPALLILGPALVIFSWGLREIQKVDIDLKKIKKFNEALLEITSTLTTVATGQGGLLGVAGNFFAMAVPWAKSPVRVGAESVYAAGKALISIATGLKEFDTLTKGLDLASYEEKGVIMPKPGSLGDRIRNIVNMLNASFSAIGASGNSGISVAKLLFGADLKPSDAEVGIKSVLKSGEALRSIAEGLLAFDQMAGGLNFVDDLSENPSNLSIQQKISKIVGMVHTSFAAIGQSANEGSSVMKKLFGVDFKKSDTEEGINAVQGIGKILTEVAEGIKVWSDLDTIGIPIEKIGENIGNIVTVISKQFGDIGKMQKSEGHWLWGGGENPVAEGIAAVSGIGGVLSGVADGIKVFANLKEIGITEKDFDSEAPGSISNNIKRIINLIADIFAEIGGGVVETEVSGSSFKFPKSKAKLIKDGIESITGIGTELKNIAESVKIFAETNIDTEKVKTQLKSIVESLTQTFAEFGSGKTINPEAVEKGVKAIKGLGTELKPIIESYKPIIEMSKDGNVNVDKIRNTMKSMLVDTVTIFAAIGGDDKSWKKMFPNDEKPDFTFVIKSKSLLEKIAESSDILGKIVESVSKIKMDDWEQRKQAIKDLFRVPVLALKDVSDMYAANTGQMDSSIQLYPRLNTQVDSVSQTIRKIDTNILAKNPISNLTKDFTSFLELAKDPNLKPKPLEALGTMVNYLERLSNIQDPFDRFQKSFREYVKDFKEYVEQINMMDIESMKQINKFTELTTEYIKVENVGMEDKLESIKLLLQEIVQASSSMFQAQATVFSENPNLASQVAVGQTNIMAPTPTSSSNSLNNDTLDKIYKILVSGITIKT